MDTHHVPFKLDLGNHLAPDSSEAIIAKVAAQKIIKRLSTITGDIHRAESSQLLEYSLDLNDVGQPSEYVAFALHLSLKKEPGLFRKKSVKKTWYLEVQLKQETAIAPEEVVFLVGEYGDEEVADTALFELMFFQDHIKQEK